MRTRDDRVRTGHPEIVDPGTPPKQPTGPTVATDPASADGELPPPPRRAAALVLALVLAAAVLVMGVLAVLGGADDDVATEPGPRPAGAVPEGPAGLGLTVEAPETVVAGETVAFVVHWTDGSGVFSGSSEDWGDGVGTSSLQQERCDPAAPAPDPAAGSYTAGHAWSEPGTYTVVIGVATYACSNGTAVVEDAAKTLTVEVTPAG
jgi:hypothetical protein